MPYFAGEAPQTGETIRLSPEETTLAERLGAFREAIECVAREHGMRVDRVHTYELSDKIEIRIDFAATSVMLRRAVS
jgi:hypothetical protein